jgi:transposase
MGRLNHEQEQFFYSFRLDDAVPGDHPVRRIATILDLDWVYSELTPYYPRIGRPSVDPVLMIRMLIVGYVYVGVRPAMYFSRMTYADARGHVSTSIMRLRWAMATA